MNRYASEIIKLAESKVGIAEGTDEHKKIIDTYNSHKPLARGYTVKYTDDWCAVFLSELAIELGYTDIIPTECGCGELLKLFQDIGCWIENENRVPTLGEYVFYDWSDDENYAKNDNKGWPRHVGIVIKISGNKFTVVEANVGNKVVKKELEVNSQYLRGFAKPKYDDEPVAETVEHWYRVQTGAFLIKLNATNYLNRVKAAGFTDAYIKKVDNYWKVQVGAFSVRKNAEFMLAKVKEAGFDGFITYS